MLTSKSIALGEKELEPVASATGSSYALADAGFIERLRAGDAEAFDKLITRYSADIYALLYRLTSDREEASDLLQETFLRAFRAINGFRGNSDLNASQARGSQWPNFLLSSSSAILRASRAFSIISTA